jgi:hypothetical protein
LTKALQAPTPAQQNQQVPITLRWARPDSFLEAELPEIVRKLSAGTAVAAPCTLMKQTECRRKRFCWPNLPSAPNRYGEFGLQ